MVVCKYFLQGTCKFGSNCYNEHQVPNNYANYSSTSILRQTNFGSPQSTKPPGTVDVNTLVKAVVTDMTGAEKGGQWLLSCYAPFKEKPAFPGFEDTSPEEIRFGYYEARKSGSVDQYNQQLQGHFQNVILKVRALQNPDQEIINILQCIYNTPPSSTSGTFGSITATSTPSSSNIFANQGNPTFSQKSGNIFQSQQMNTSIFGGGSQQIQTQSNIFPNATNGNVLSQNQGNIFNNQPDINIFGAAQQSSNIFRGGAQGSQNVFAGANIGNTAAFANQSGVYAQPQQQQNIFPLQTQQIKPPLQNVFAPSAQPTNVFNNNSNVFPPMQNPQSPSAGVQNYSSSIFGDTSKNNTPQQTFDESLYSKVEELTEEEKKNFENENFDIMNIPEKPPTYNMCFK